MQRLPSAPRRPGLRAGRGLATLAVIAALAGCAGGPPRGADGDVVFRPGPAPSWERDGAHANPPEGLEHLPDAVPVVETIRRGGPNKPYRVLGRDYVPVASDQPMRERGFASWYGKKFHGRQTANGEVYDMYAMTAAHPTMPLPSYARVRNLANGREIIVRVNDRGPFHPGRVIDLSYAAAKKLGLLNHIGRVEVTRLTHDEIASGAWRRGGSEIAPEAAPEAAPEVMEARAAEPDAQAVEVPAAAVRPVAAITPAPEAAPAAAAVGGFWLQLGAFRQRDGAERFQRSVATGHGWLAPLLGIHTQDDTHRLQAGPYDSRDAAQAAAERVREDLRLVPLIVERP